MQIPKSSCSPYLSKSLFIRGLQCHKSLYLHKHHPDLKDEVGDELQARFEAGYEIGELALELFPGGVMGPYEGFTHEEQLKRTRDELEKGALTIYEAAFSHDDIFVKVDILHHGSRGWEIYEVKSSSSVKDVHLNDAAIQYHVVTSAGLPVSRVSIVHVNNGYVRDGGLNEKKLLMKKNITKDVLGLQEFVCESVKGQRAMLLGGEPAIDIGPHCSAPYDCDFTGHCWKHIPEDSVFDLRERGADKFELYRQGIIRQQDIPLDWLNNKQRQQVEATLTKKNTISKMGVKEFLKTLWHPLCFLDFETFYTAVPQFDGTRPYQQIPFQYSLHVQEKPGAKVKHYEHLAVPGVDPREELLERLITHIPRRACVLTFNQKFESGILNGLADRFPKHKKGVNAIVRNIRDLMVPFQKRHIYLWQMKGSYSLKAVLPAIFPDLSYEELEIGNGSEASTAYFEMCAEENPKEREKIRKALLEYCKLDTLGLVKILENMKALVQGKGTIR